MSMKIKRNSVINRLIYNDKQELVARIANIRGTRAWWVKIYGGDCKSFKSYRLACQYVWTNVS